MGVDARREASRPLADAIFEQMIGKDGPVTNFRVIDFGHGIDSLFEEQLAKRVTERINRGTVTAVAVDVKELASAAKLCTKPPTGTVPSRARHLRTTTPRSWARWSSPPSMTCTALTRRCFACPSWPRMRLGSRCCSAASSSRQKAPSWSSYLSRSCWASCLATSRPRLTPGTGSTTSRPCLVALGSASSR